MMDHLWPWIGFNAFVLVMLALDLGVFHRKAHVVSFKESIAWTVVWVSLAMLSTQSRRARSVVAGVGSPAKSPWVLGSSVIVMVGPFG